jgi:hypothetical protein
LGFPDIGFAQGKSQALFVGDFLYADSSTPSNFTVFAFHEQAPLSDFRQNDYLICQLVQTQGQKKSLDEIKASLKQRVHVPTDFNSIWGLSFNFSLPHARSFSEMKVSVPRV